MAEKVYVAKESTSQEIKITSQEILEQVKANSLDSFFQTNVVASADCAAQADIVMFSGSIDASVETEVFSFTVPETGVYIFTASLSKRDGNYGSYKITADGTQVANCSSRYGQSIHLAAKLQKGQICKYLATVGSKVLTKVSYKFVENVVFCKFEKGYGTVETFVSPVTGTMLIGFQASSYLSLKYDEDGISHTALLDGYSDAKGLSDSSYLNEDAFVTVKIPVYKGHTYSIYFRNSSSSLYYYGAYFRAYKQTEISSPKIIKSVQRGNFIFTSSETEKEITIGSVDFSKCIVLLDNCAFLRYVEGAMRLRAMDINIASWQIVEFW